MSESKEWLNDETFKDVPKAESTAINKESIATLALYLVENKEVLLKVAEEFASQVFDHSHNKINKYEDYEGNDDLPIENMPIIKKLSQNFQVDQSVAVWSDLLAPYHMIQLPDSPPHAPETIWTTREFVNPESRHSVPVWISDYKQSMYPGSYDVVQPYWNFMFDMPKDILDFSFLTKAEAYKKKALYDIQMSVQKQLKKQ